MSLAQYLSILEYTSSVGIFCQSFSAGIFYQIFHQLEKWKRKFYKKAFFWKLLYIPPPGKFSLDRSDSEIITDLYFFGKCFICPVMEKF